jgi:hypothetical protein
LPAGVTIESVTGEVLTTDRLSSFTDLLRRSVATEGAGDETAECIQAISNGNIRTQLDLVYRFVTSGQTKIEEYLAWAGGDRSYAIPFHEVLHSVILGDKRLYSEGGDATFINVFEPGLGPQASHFTILRLIEYLIKNGQRGEMREATYIPLESLVSRFYAIGVGRDELVSCIRRMMFFGLLVARDLVNYGAPEAASREVRAPLGLTPAGFYYRSTLYSKFSYFVCMSMDTTLRDEGVHHAQERLLRTLGNQAKVPVEDRISLAATFLQYLERAEDREIHAGSIGRDPELGTTLFVPAMRAELEAVERDARRANGGRGGLLPWKGQ